MNDATIQVLQTQLGHIVEQLDDIRDMVKESSRRSEQLETRVRDLERGHARTSVAVAIAGSLGTAAIGVAIKAILGG